jgi:23S rRNA (guanine745-N1)-methyltransferase
VEVHEPSEDSLSFVDGAGAYGAGAYGAGEVAMLKPHSPEWYDRLARMQRGYFYPWKVEVAPESGEDTYLRLVREHLMSVGLDFPPGQPGARDVLDVGCGHGEVALEIAPLARRVVAYDRVSSYVEIGREAARERGVRNVDFVLADSSAAANGGKPRIPSEDGAFDLIISRRGPTHWIEDARRVARPGAVLLQLNPLEGPDPPWSDELPPDLRLAPAASQNIRASVERRLGIGGLRLHSAWTYDVPQRIPDAWELYHFLTFGRLGIEVPAWEQVREFLEAVFARHATARGLDVRLRRFLWKAVVE